MINIPKTAIFLPTYHRADRLPNVIQNIFENTPQELFNLYLIIEGDDTQTKEMAKALGVTTIINKGTPCYADCINTAYKETEDPYFFSAADDLDFKPNWLKEAMRYMTDRIGVVGTNDLGTIPIGPARDATHYLVRRNYIVQKSGRIDAPDTVLYPYKHNYTDKEFVETARKRHAYVYCPTAIVEHLHWAWNKGKMDETYQKGFSTNKEDQATFESRRHLWE